MVSKTIANGTSYYFWRWFRRYRLDVDKRGRLLSSSIFSGAWCNDEPMNYADAYALWTKVKSRIKS